MEPTVLRTDRPEVIDPEVSLLSDSKGLYDALNNELPQDDKKCGVEMPIIEGMLARMRGRSRWIPHNVNPADALTKLKGAHVEPLLSLLKTGFYHLQQEEAQLKERAAQKESLGAAPRLKASGKKSSNSKATTTFFCVQSFKPHFQYTILGLCVHSDVEVTD